MFAKRFLCVCCGDVCCKKGLIKSYLLTDFEVIYAA